MTNIKPIFAKFFNHKPSQPLVKCVTDCDERVMSVLVYCKEPFEQLAKKHNIRLNIAQHDDLLLINSGAKTAAIKMSETATPAEIIENVYKNATYNIK